MTREMLYPDQKPMVHRHSSMEQYKGFFAVMSRGGWTPIVFDQLDGITCETIHSHPVIISFGDDIGYHFDDGECTYASDKFIYFDERGVGQAPLPECMGGAGELYKYAFESNNFINFDDDSSLGVHNEKTLRVGLDYVVSDETLPSA